jgi:hypothetical protein
MLHFNACHGKKRKDKADIKLITFVPGCVVGPEEKVCYLAIFVSFSHM